MSVVYNITFTPTIGSLGTLIEYKNADDTEWITPTLPANPTTLATYPLSLETDNTYDIRVSSYGGNCTPRYRIINLIVDSSPLCCPDGYTLSADETYCFLESGLEPTILQSDICLAAAPLINQYAFFGTYLYDPGYTIRLVGTNTLLTSEPLWKDFTGSAGGPFNRDAVWVDTDCNGTKDSLTLGQELKITYLLSLTEATTMFVGIAGDNTFKLELNGVTIVDCDTLNPAQGGPSSNNFNFFYLFPVDLVGGDNYFVFSAVGDGTTNDSFAAVIYNNTAAELAAATSLGELTVLFRTIDLLGQHIDIATCPVDYFLDTTAGQGNYICRQILTTASTPC